MKRLICSIVLVGAASFSTAQAATITIDSVNYPDFFAFTVEWGPGTVSPNTVNSVDLPGVYMFTGYPTELSVQVWDGDPLHISFPDPQPARNLRVDFGILQQFLPYTYFSLDAFTTFAFQTDGTFDQSTRANYNYPIPIVSPTADGYGAHFLYQKIPLLYGEPIPPLPDQCSSASAMTLAMAVCIGFGRRNRRLPGRESGTNA